MAHATIDRFKSGYGLEVIVKMGDITDADADGIVTGENENLQGTGQVTRALMKKLPLFKEKRDELKDKKLKAWTVHETPVSDKFKFVLHALFTTDDKDWVRKMIKLYEKILEKAVQHKMKALAIPLLASGNGRVDPNDAVQALVTAIAAYKPYKPFKPSSNSLQHVLILTKDTDKYDKIVTQCQYQFSQLSQSDTSRKFFSLPRAKEKSLSLPAAGTSSGPQANRPVDVNQEIDDRIVDVRPKKFGILKRATSELAVTSVPVSVSTENVTRVSVPKDKDKDSGRSRKLFSWLRPKETPAALSAVPLSSSGISVNQRTDAKSETNVKRVDDFSGKMHINTEAEANTGVEFRQSRKITYKRSVSEPPEGRTGGVIRVLVSKESETYRDVAKSFLRSFPKRPTIKKIERIESKVLQSQYLTKKAQFLGRPNPSHTEIERILWHRTSEESSSFICENGFNRGRSGRHDSGSAGDGVYFTTSPNVSIEDTYMYSAIEEKHLYATIEETYQYPVIEDRKYVFRAQVLTGTYTKGTPGIRVPPELSNGELYDSTVDNVNNPSLYVIYNDTQAYPEYLITYI